MECIAHQTIILNTGKISRLNAEDKALEYLATQSLEADKPPKKA